MFKKLKEKIKKKLDDEKISDVIDFIKFILIHGVLGLFILLIMVSIIGINFTITTLIRNSCKWTIFVFLIGSGAGYYMLMDVVKFFNEMKTINRK